MTTAVVRYHQEPEGWWAETDVLPTFSAAGDSFEEVRVRAHTALRELVGPELELEDDVTGVGAAVGVVVHVVETSPSGFPTTLHTSIGGSGTSVTRKAGPAAVRYVPVKVAAT